MHPRTRLLLAGASLLALLVVMGCPTLKLGNVAVKEGSVSPAGFTLVAEAIVEELDETEGPDQQRQSGRGLLGVHLPAGWSVSGARMRSPDETVERALFAGELEVDELPSRWADAYEEHLGIRPPDDARGVLQDVHWSMGYFGYFPTYTLGNLIMAQLFRAAGESLGDLEAMFERGEFAPFDGYYVPTLFPESG